jgi:hypothetical protein
MLRFADTAHQLGAASATVREHRLREAERAW